jgi:VanZ family protein
MRFIIMNKSLVRSRIFALSMAIIILAGSSVPGNNIPHFFTFTPDKLIHCLEYAVLGFFLFQWLRLEYASHTLTWHSVTTVISGSLMAIIDENYQRLIPERFPDFWDWVLDFAGVLLIVILLNFLIKRKIYIEDN